MSILEDLIDRKMKKMIQLSILMLFLFLMTKGFYNKVYNLGQEISFCTFPYMENKMFMSDTQKEIEKKYLIL